MVTHTFNLSPLFLFTFLFCIITQGQSNHLFRDWGTAIKHKDICKIQKALSAGACVNAAIDSYSYPLTAAIYNDSQEIVALLLDAGADPDTSHQTTYPKDKITCLYIASAKENFSIVQLLLNAGANPNKQTILSEYEDEAYNISPLQIAAIKRNRPIVRELLLHGASALIDVTNSQLTPEAHALIEDYVPLITKQHTCIVNILEQVHGVPRDLTRLIWLFAGASTAHIPLAPGNNHTMQT